MRYPQCDLQRLTLSYSQSLFTMTQLNLVPSMPTPPYQPPPFVNTSLLPLSLAKVVYEQRSNNEAGEDMITLCLLSAMSGGFQDKIKVETLSGQFVHPIIWTFVISQSGSRKSTIERALTKFFTVFETRISEKLQAAKAEQAAAILVWHADMESLEKKLRSDPDDQEAAKLKEAIASMLQNEPAPIEDPRVLYQDTTMEGLLQGLRKWPSAMISSSESGSIFSSRAFSNLSQLNLFWDAIGDRYIDRVNRPSFILKDPKLTLSLMGQAGVVDDFLSGKGHLARDSGFLARFLVSQPQNLVGTRFNFFHSGSSEHTDQFQARMLELMLAGVTDNGKPVEPKILRLSSDARAALRHFANNVEADMGPGRYLCDVPDAASKLAENAVRVAALLHFYEGVEGDIPTETLIRATQLCSRYMEEFKRLFSPPPALPLEYQDAAAVESCLRKFSDLHQGTFCLPKKYLFTHGPNAVRKRARLDLALTVLVQQNKLQLQKVNRTMWVNLNPYFFPGASQQPPYPGTTYY